MEQLILCRKILISTGLAQLEQSQEDYTCGETESKEVNYVEVSDLELARTILPVLSVYLVLLGRQASFHKWHFLSWQLLHCCCELLTILAVLFFTISTFVSVVSS